VPKMYFVATALATAAAVLALTPGVPPLGPQALFAAALVLVLCTVVTESDREE
jgi:hypothetical protein